MSREPSPTNHRPPPEMAEIGHVIRSVARRLANRGRSGGEMIRSLKEALELGSIHAPGALRDLPEDLAWIVVELASGCLPDVERRMKEPEEPE